MGTFSEIYPWQRLIWQQLQSYIKQQRIPQALLFSGVAGIGKRHLANVYAAGLLCNNPDMEALACGLCIACKLILANTHPDYLSIIPEEHGKAIKIDQIRDLNAKMGLKPQFERNRFVVIHPADSLNRAAANAFLKCLEEPSERTSIILISEQPSKLPATIKSRCQHIHFSAADRTIAKQWLFQNGVIADVEELLLLSQGAPILAKTYAESKFLELRLNFFDNWLQVANGDTNLLLVAERWYKQEDIPLNMLIYWLSDWISEIIKLAYGIESINFGNANFTKPLQALAERLELKLLFKFYDTLLNCNSQLATQINKQLLMEQILIDWYQLNNH